MKTFILFISLSLALLASTARADTVVALYAPTEPFPSTGARVELAKKLGEAFGGVGKVYARAGDFASAVKKGEVTIAVVDATYLASAGGGYVVIAAATRGGDATHGWQLVARGADKVKQLEGKRVLVPSVGGRETDLVLNVLLGGVLPKGFFGKIEASPDTASTLAALALGKADAAVIPASVELPSGVTTVLALPQLSGPVLVAYGSPSATTRQQIADAAGKFTGDATVGGFKPTDGEAVRAIARRFTIPVKRGPHAVPAVRVVVGDLVEGRTFSIERAKVEAFAIAPDAKGVK